MIDFAHAVAAAVPTASDNSTSLLVTLTVVAAGTAAFALLRLRQTQALTAGLQEAVQAATQARKSGEEQLRKLQADLEGRREELKGLKQEVATQRKKNHAAQEEARKLRDNVREQTRLRIEAQNTRPAFAEIPEPKPAQKVVAAPPPPPPPAPVVSDAQLEAKLKKVEAELHGMQAKYVEEQQVAAAFKEELKKTRKRSEDLRRIDIITKSKMELLEDKLRGMGRQYYEAVSELAALKGEVVPPKPRDLPPEREAPTDDDDTLEETLERHVEDAGEGAFTAQ